MQSIKSDKDLSIFYLRKPCLLGGNFFNFSVAIVRAILGYNILYLKPKNIAAYCNAVY